jgi:branched-chain amino acid transport system ATP-binding protein
VPLEYARPEGDRGKPLEDEAMALLDLVGLKARAHEGSADLTQVDLRKLELARALAAEPALLVADEAMAGLSSAEVDDILAILFRLNERGVAVIMIEHIMRAVMRFSERVVVLDAGQKIAEGSPDRVISDPAVERAYLGA